jgi:hypothetical protein
MIPSIEKEYRLLIGKLYGVKGRKEKEKKAEDDDPPRSSA